MAEVNPMAEVMFLCHGRVHDRPRVAKVPQGAWERGTYLDVDPRSLADDPRPVASIPAAAYALRFKAIIALHCPANAYAHKGRLSARFFGNVACWLKPGGVYITTGVPWMLARTLTGANDDKSEREWMLLKTTANLVGWRTSRSPAERAHYEYVMRYAQAHPSTWSRELLKAVERAGTAADAHRRLAEFRERYDKGEAKAINAFAREVARVTNGRLSLRRVDSTPDCLVFDKKT